MMEAAEGKTMVPVRCCWQAPTSDPLFGEVRHQRKFDVPYANNTTCVRWLQYQRTSHTQ